MEEQHWQHYLFNSADLMVSDWGGGVGVEITFSILLQLMFLLPRSLSPADSHVTSYSDLLKHWFICQLLKEAFSGHPV